MDNPETEVTQDDPAKPTLAQDLNTGKVGTDGTDPVPVVLTGDEAVASAMMDRMRALEAAASAARLHVDTLAEHVAQHDEHLTTLADNATALATGLNDIEKHPFVVELIKRIVHLERAARGF